MIAAGILAAIAATALAFAGLGMAGHMAAHMLAVAVAAPLIALGLPRRTLPGGPLAMMVAELLLVWGWHLPALRDAADHAAGVALVEQAMFLAAGVALWRASLAAPAIGGGALLLTSMHMTLLGALITLAPRPLYAMMAMHPAPGLDALADQQLGGAIMLAIGGASYLAGGLWLLGAILRGRAVA
jgi:putative membrane protein